MASKKDTAEKLVKRQDNILAEGEVTGHAHRAIAPDAEVFDAENGRRVLNTPTGTRIVHEEHKEQMIPPGEYDRDLVQEFNHPAEEARAVRD